MVIGIYGGLKGLADNMVADIAVVQWDLDINIIIYRKCWLLSATTYKEHALNNGAKYYITVRKWPPEFLKPKSTIYPV